MLWCSLFVADVIVGMEELELHYRCRGRSKHSKSRIATSSVRMVSQSPVCGGILLFQSHSIGRVRGRAEGHTHTHTHTHSNTHTQTGTYTRMLHLPFSNLPLKKCPNPKSQKTPKSDRKKMPNSNIFQESSKVHCPRMKNVSHLSQEQNPVQIHGLEMSGLLIPFFVSG